MSLGELLDAIRKAYVERLGAAVRGDEDAIPEPALRTKDGSLAREGPLSLPLRGDVFSGGQVVSVDSDRMVSFEPLEFVWEKSLRVELRPFHWDSVPVEFKGIGFRTDWRTLVNWFEVWFDGEEQRRPDRDGLLGVVHFLSDPKQSEESVTFSVDLGSASVEAFEELLDIAVKLGAGGVTIGGKA